MLFSHVPDPEPVPGPADTAAGDPALDARWRAATTGWRSRSVDRDEQRTWAWVRHGWEALLEPGDGSGRAADVLLVAALLAVQQRFLAVGTEDPDTVELPDPREDGAPLEDAELLAVLGEHWELDPAEAEQDPEGFARLVGGFLQDHLTERSDEVLGALVERWGATTVFAQLWSLGRPGEVEADPDRPAFPLSTDEIAWIVSGVPAPEKHLAWEWVNR